MSVLSCSFWPALPPGINTVTPSWRTFKRLRAYVFGPGTLYGAITRLAGRGWIRPLDSDERRRPYRLTAEGWHYLREQLKGLSAVVKTGLRRLEEA
jgi:DNA-binding PadR family transcriptional regulator